MPLSAGAVGLGKFTVISAIGEPFHAEVELISASAVDRASLTARLATPETFRRFNLSYGARQAGLLVSVEARPTGEPYVKIGSTRYVREPILPLLIELAWSDGRLTRTYTALLDLPSFDAHPVPPFAAAGDSAAPPARVEPAPARPEAGREPAPAPAAVRERARAVAPADATGIAAAREPAKGVKPVAGGEAPRAAGAAIDRDLEARARALEQAAIAEDKVLAAARDRVAQLETTIKEMKLLVEGGAPVPGQEAVMAEPTPRAEQAPVAPAAKPAPRKPPVDAPVPAAQPEPGLADVMMDNLPLLGGGAAVLLLGALWLARRRRLTPAAQDDAAPAGEDEDAERGDATPPAQMSAGAEAEQIDPLEEARIFIAHGRAAQAAQVLEDALAEHPSRAEVWLKLLEVDMARKDKDAFGRHARAFRELTAGQGENWLKAAAMGFALDPDNALYEAGRGAVESVVPDGSEALDFDSQGETPAPAAERGQADDEDDIESTLVIRPTGPEAKRESGVDFDMTEPPGGETTTDISFDVPDAGTPATDLVLDAEEAEPKSTDDDHVMDFKIELPEAGESPEEPAEAAPAEGGSQDADPGRKFEVDLSGINLELDDEPKTGPAPDAGGKDPHWHDVQEKFELAKAYQVLGEDVDSVIEILRDIVKEGDAQQRAEARKLMDRLSGKDK